MKSKIVMVLAILVILTSVCYASYITHISEWRLSSSMFDAPTVSDYAVFTETTEPTAVSGGFYYNGSSFYGCKDGSNWTEFSAGAATSLDGCYDEGSGITVDTGAIALTSSDDLDAAVLAIDQKDTGAYNAVTLHGDATAALLDFDQAGTGGDILGTGDTWSISKTGAFVINGSLTFSTADVLFDGSDAAEDIQYDTSANLLHFLDAAALGFGGSADGAADISMEYEGTGDTLDITGSGKTIEIGATGNTGLDIKIWGLTGDYATFGEDESALLFVDYDVWFDDTSDVFFGTTKNVGFLMQYSSSKTMAILAGANSDDFALNIGVDQSGVDLGLYGTTASAKLLFDSSVNAMIFDAIDIHLGDEDVIQFGDTTDAVLSYDATKDQLEYRELTTGDHAIFQIVGGEGKEGRLIIAADDDDEATDQWQLSVDTSGVLAFGNDTVADTFTDHLSIAAGTGNVTLTGDIVNEGGDTIIMSGDDIFSFTSDDDNATILILGNADAKSAILDLSADAAAQDVDTWNFTVADGGALTIANDAAATMTVAEAMDITGTITLGEDEVMSNAVDDTVSFTSDSTHMTLQILGHADAGSAIIDLSADAAADDVDTWLITVADAGAMTIANDGTATMTINEVVAFGSGKTIADVAVTDEASYSVLAANSGKIHILTDFTQETTLALPVEADGLNYEFWYCGGAEEAHEFILTSANNTNFFIGGVMFHDTDDGSVASVVSDGNSNDQLTLHDLRDGTHIKITCDGVRWYITGTVCSDTTPVFAD